MIQKLFPLLFSLFLVVLVLGFQNCSTLAHQGQVQYYSNPEGIGNASPQNTTPRDLPGSSGGQ